MNPNGLQCASHLKPPRSLADCIKIERLVCCTQCFVMQSRCVASKKNVMTAAGTHTLSTPCINITQNPPTNPCQIKVGRGGKHYKRSLVTGQSLCNDLFLPKSYSDAVGFRRAQLASSSAHMLVCREGKQGNVDPTLP